MNVFGGSEKIVMIFLAHLSVVIFFTLAYWLTHTSITNKEALGSTFKKAEDLDLFDCFYFSIVTQTTVGYGDIVATHPIAKAINILQLMTVYGVLTYGLIV